MNLIILSPRKALNKAFLKVKPNRSDIESFKRNLIKLLNQINESESEEFHKNIVSDFLKNTYYKENHFINTKGRNDLVIHNGKDAISSVGVIIEAKKPTNKSEMLRTDNINTKAFQELVLYYLRERITLKNLEIKYLIVTNIFEWFIFDAQLFERLFANSKPFIKQFKDFEEKRLSDTRTDFFYNEIAEPFINDIKTDITFTHIDIRDFEKPLRNADKQDDNKLIALFKLLSPEHLLKLPFANDSNSLDKSFYTELLHIIGLTEIKEGGKKLIERKKEGARDPGSLIENAINQLESLDKISRLEKPQHFGETNKERLFNIALELSITWINRILFLKLLEAQLIKYNKGDKSFSFLNLEKVQNYDDLNSLFFSVLARNPEERNGEIKKLFARVPYLNSSLFEPTEIEHTCLFISQLGNKKLPVLNATVLKDKTGKKRTAAMDALEYLFEFLDAYDFASEGSEEIQEENKALINASVLGLIFEKINGYKDGSFFTPGFITMYMCRETIRRAIVQKFNESKKWNCQDINELYDKIEDKKEANSIINSLKICDPAVGSGHFLVSALNEIIAIKNDLRILSDREGKRLKEYSVEVVNDELIVTDEDGKIFEYNPQNKESQRIQETLFHEKQTIIENSLFGVDINPNSIKICRLRLWIELLKNAYYKAPTFTELETLPNIDINIKCGNSLISRYALDADIHQALRRSKWSIDSYRLAVMTYRNAENKSQKQAMEKLIDQIKSDFESEVASNDRRVVRLRNAKDDLKAHATQPSLFELTKAEKAAWEKKLKKLTTDIKRIETELEEIKNNKIYEYAFEWRFEFPEVLNDEGDFVGFDVVIGNPPYIKGDEITSQKEYLSSLYKVFTGNADLYTYFFEQGVHILRSKGLMSFITPNKWIQSNYGIELRRLIIEKNIIELIDFGELNVFEEASTFPSILLLSNNDSNEEFIRFLEIQSIQSFIDSNFEPKNLRQASLKPEKWLLDTDNIANIIQRVENSNKTLGTIFSNQLYAGIKTGANDVLILSEEELSQILSNYPEEKILFKKICFGKDIRRYQGQLSISKYLFFPYLFDGKENKLISLDNYPGTMRYLMQHYEVLSNRAIIKDGIAKSTHKWYELQQVNRFFNYATPKIIYPDISLENRFFYDEAGLLPDMTCFFIPTTNIEYIAILNSTIFKFFASKYCPVLGNVNQGGRIRYKSTYLSKIPMPHISNNNKELLSEKVNKILAAKKQDPNADTSALEKEIDQLVYQLYGLTEEEIQIVEQN